MMAFSLRSPSFEHEGAIPGKHTCQGDDAAPALAWSDAPANTKSFVLIVDEWASIADFQQFFANPDLQAFIGSVGGDPAAPEITVTEALASPDEF